MVMENRDAELPPIEVEQNKDDRKGTEKSEPVRALGTERNPEFTTQTHTTTPAKTVQDNTSVISSNDDSSSSNLQSGNDSSALVGNSPQIADDVDLIEKEWVEKAKEIVGKTKENPYLQNKAISEIKADYIQKRYNKNIAKSEG